MFDTIMKKGIPLGILMAIGGVAVDVYYQGVLDYKFNSLKFVGVSILGGILIGVLLYYFGKKK